MTNTDTTPAPAKCAAEIRRDELVAIAENLGHVIERVSDPAEGVFEVIVRGRFDTVQVVVRQSKFPTRSSVWAQIIDTRTNKSTKLAAGEIRTAITGTAPAEQFEQAPAVDGHADVNLAVDDDRIPFDYLNADTRLHRVTGVQIIRIGNVWHVQAPGDKPRTGGNPDFRIDNIMPYAHTVVRAELKRRELLPADVDGTPIPVDAIVECVGPETGTLTGKRGRVTESSVEADGPGRVLIDLGDRHGTHARSANRVRVIEHPPVEPAEADGDTLVDGPVNGFAIGDTVRWGTDPDQRPEWRIARLYVPLDGAEPYAGLESLTEANVGTAGRLSLLTRVVDRGPSPAEVDASLGELGLVRKGAGNYESPLGVMVFRHTDDGTWWAYALNRPGTSERKCLCSNQRTLAAALPYVAQYLDELREQIEQALDDAHRAAGVTVAIMIPGPGELGDGTTLVIEGERFEIPTRHEGGGTMFARRLGETIHAAGYELDGPDFASVGLDTEAGRAYRIRLRDFEPVLDGNGNPVPLPVPMHTAPLDLMRALYPGRVPAPQCPHYMLKGDREAGATTCEKRPCVEAAKAPEVDDEQVEQPAAELLANGNGVAVVLRGPDLAAEVTEALGRLTTAQVHEGDREAIARAFAPMVDGMAHAAGFDQAPGAAAPVDPAVAALTEAFRRIHALYADRPDRTALALALGVLRELGAGEIELVEVELPSAVATLAELTAAGRVPVGLGDTGGRRFAGEVAAVTTAVMAELGFTHPQPTRYVHPSGAELVQIGDRWTAHAAPDMKDRGDKLATHPSLAALLPVITEWIDDQGPTKINIPAPTDDQDAYLVGTPAGRDAEAEAEQAELDALRAAVELHRPLMRDQYGHEVDDASAAKHFRCRACGINTAGPKGCTTWSTARPSGE